VEQQIEHHQAVQQKNWRNRADATRTGARGSQIANRRCQYPCGKKSRRISYS
jgi:hypothetical protein